MAPTTTITTVAGDLLDQRVDALVLGVSTDLLLGASALEEALRAPEHEATLQALYAAQGAVVGAVIVAPAERLGVKQLLYTVTHSELTPPTDSSVALCVERCLERAEQLGCTSVALPALGSRLCHYTMGEVARTSLFAARHYLEAHPQTALTELRFVLPYDTDLDAWTTAREELDRPPAPLTPPPPAATIPT